MPHHAHHTVSPNEVSNRRSAVQKRQPSIVLVVVGLLAGVAMICTALIVPIVWTAVTEAASQPKLTYEQCSAMTEDANRLDCFDSVSRKISLHAGKNVYRTTPGDILRASERPGVQ